MDKDNRTVNHKTRVILHLLDDPVQYDIISQAEPLTPNAVRQFSINLQTHLERVAAMMELLVKKDFVLILDKSCIYADSETVEAQEAKRYLLENGFRDREFQISLEYTRKWGMM